MEFACHHIPVREELSGVPPNSLFDTLSQTIMQI
jgi:hypothetical protein